VGAKEATGLEKIRPDKSNYLWDKYLYDSEIEHEILQVKPPPKVIVYGKLPRRSIKLPTYTGATTTPDFVYAIKNNDSEDIKLHFIVETKSNNMRLSDIKAIDAQQKAFAKIGGNIEWKMETDVAVFEKDLREMA
jgi:type III restriction enzyme